MANGIENIKHNSQKQNNIKEVYKEVILAFPSEPLHTNILGPVFDFFEMLQNIHSKEMETVQKT